MNDPRIVVEISADRMEASLRILAVENMPRPSRREVEDAIAATGVVYGLMADNIEAALADDRGEETTVVARGEVPVAGEDGHIEVDAELIRPAGTPRELPDGRVDYRDLGIIRNVEAGRRVAWRIAPTAGFPGRTVLGEEIPPPPGKVAEFKLGKNVVVDPDGEHLVAATGGQLELAPQGIVEVHACFAHEGDVDLGSGDIDFIGSVRVAGAVREGATVRAQKDVEVEGWIAGATVIAGGNILVKQGIRGRQHGHVEAGGNVTARFIENAAVKAAGNVEVGEAIMHSRVEAGGEVVVRGRKGLLVGGTVIAGQRIVARVIGSQLATRTVLEVGVDPGLKQQLADLIHRLQNLDKQLDEVSKALTFLERAGGSPSGEKRNAFLKLKRLHYHLLHQRPALTKQKEELEASIQDNRKGRVECGERLFPGVKVTIGANEMFFQDQRGMCTLVLRAGGDIGPA